MIKTTFLSAAAALMLSTASASAAVFTYDLSDNGTAGFSGSPDYYNYGLRLDGYAGTIPADEDDKMIFSFEPEAGKDAATLQYDDVNGIVQINGTMRRSLATDSSTGGEFGDVWAVTYQLLGVTNVGLGMFISETATGSGSISDGTNTLDLGTKSRGNEYFLLTQDSDRSDKIDGVLTGEGWVNTPSIWMSTNDFLFNATLAGTDPGGNLTPVPLPATGLLLVAALGGLGAMRRRKTA